MTSPHTIKSWSEKTTLQQSLQHRLSFLAYTEFNKDRLFKQEAVSIRKQNQKFVTCKYVRMYTLT